MTSKKPKICMFTLGCKVNQEESNSIAEWFTENGYEVVHGFENADAYIINTCTVTSMADKKSRQKIRQARKLNPDAIIAAIGCYPEVSNLELFEKDEVDILIGNEKKEDVTLIISYELKKRGLYPAEVSKNESESKIASSLHVRTRAYIKIEDGCDRFCAYCIIPFARGKVKSRNLKEIINEVEILIKRGYKEIVVTGINIALYGNDLTPNVTLFDLLSSISALNGNFRIRLGSLEPNVIDIGMAKKIARLPKLCPQWHLSLQSGSDKILYDMNRIYSMSQYKDMVNELKKIDPQFAITTDIIVGFPGETDEDFQESVKAVETLEFSNVHTFKYSRREGTEACKMSNQIPEQIKTERSQKLIEIANASSNKFISKNFGVTREVLVFGLDKSKKYYRGITDNGIEVKISIQKFDKDVSNEFVMLSLDDNSILQAE